jgi:hypothetical protein
MFLTLKINNLAFFAGGGKVLLRQGLARQPKLASNSQSSCLSLQSATTSSSLPVQFWSHVGEGGPMYLAKQEG